MVHKGERCVGERVAKGVRSREGTPCSQFTQYTANAARFGGSGCVGIFQLSDLCA